MPKEAVGLPHLIFPSASKARAFQKSPYPGERTAPNLLQLTTQESYRRLNRFPRFPRTYG